jgi:hypothetical protein
VVGWRSVDIKKLLYPIILTFSPSSFGTSIVSGGGDVVGASPPKKAKMALVEHTEAKDGVGGKMASETKDGIGGSVLAGCRTQLQQQDQHAAVKQLPVSAEKMK